MTETTLEQRISVLEAQLADKAEGGVTQLHERIEARFERSDSRLESVQRDVAVIKHAVKAILTRLP